MLVGAVDSWRGTTPTRLIRHTGSLNTADPQVQADLAGQPPQSAIGWIARGIQQRERTGACPLTIISCDKLSWATAS